MDWSQLQQLVDWGTVPDWFGAVGSIASVLFVYLGLRREIRSRRSDELRARATQARLVSAVAEVRGSSVVRIVVSNESDAPVLDLAATPCLPPPGDGTGPAVELAAPKQVRRIHGRENHELFVTLAAGRSLTPADGVSVELIFTDHDGNRWRRSGAGQPEPAD
ncbi:hypothetical protein [Micromonospora sp. NPDC047074]|uniref:hypothetical protein n=1 Tax=Micromonospora sp. NPDC047074 TaxID=3154339 RepID=UPI0033D816D4